MNKIKNVTVGSDPEFLIFSELENKFISAIGMCNGTKENPEPITDKGHMIQIDGVGFEYNIPPCSTAEGFVKEINFVKDYIYDTILKPKDLLISNSATGMFKDDQLQSKDAWEIGCSPDMNCWTFEVNHPRKYESNLRAVGGHVAVGYDKPDEDTSIKLLQAMDLFLGVPSVLLDNDTERRQLYGKSGAFRFTKFGVEYRVLSNFWIFNPVLTKWVFDNTLLACDFVNINGVITNEEDIQEAINTCNKELALEIIDDYRINIPILTDMEVL